MGKKRLFQVKLTTNKKNKTMNYTKNIEVMGPGLHTYRNQIKTFGSDEGLRAIFEIEKSEIPGKIEMDKNFVRAYTGLKKNTVLFTSHMFNVSNTAELQKALNQKENQRVLQLEYYDDCLFSVYVSDENFKGRELFEMMRGHIALLYSLHHEMLNYRHISEDSHRPSIYEYSPIQIQFRGLDFRLFDPLCDEYELINRVLLIRNMYDSAKSGESAKDFINKFFKSGEFEKYTLNAHNKTFKKIYKSLAFKFMRCLTSDAYTFNIGTTELLNYFYDTCPKGERI